MLLFPCLQVEMSKDLNYSLPYSNVVGGDTCLPDFHVCFSLTSPNDIARKKKIHITLFYQLDLYINLLFHQWPHIMKIPDMNKFSH